ncbi:hypothetical protein [Fusobacterium necrophorum]|uniref:hypothetical protein n=1 Tax=Fusobacterium necrophorum TaxID=859 RepID=UPI00255027F0|nr:hypothetical protein [Fusobacterium necrophorum]MDK4523136.1 hypothetical protein [Fusobacterium necrophorum]
MKMNEKKLRKLVDDFVHKYQLEEFDAIEFKIIRNNNPIVGCYGSVLRYYEGQLYLITEFEEIEFGHIRWGKGAGRLIERAIKHLRPNLMFYYRDEDIPDDIDMAVVTLTDCPKMSNGWIYVPSIGSSYAPDRSWWYDKKETKQWRRRLKPKSWHRCFVY